MSNELESKGNQAEEYSGVRYETNMINLFDTPKKENYTIQISSSPEISTDTKESFQTVNFKQSTSSALGSAKRKGKEFINRHEWKRRKFGNQEKPKLKSKLNGFSNRFAFTSSNTFEPETSNLNINQKIFTKNVKTFLNFSEANKSKLNASKFESDNIKQTSSYYDKSTLIYPSCSNSVSHDEPSKNNVKIESFGSPLKQDEILIKVSDEYSESDEEFSVSRFENKTLKGNGKIDECNCSNDDSNDDVISGTPNLVKEKLKSRLEACQNSMENKLNLNSNIIEMYNSPKKTIRTSGGTFHNSFRISSSDQLKEKKAHSSGNYSDFKRMSVRIDLSNKNTPRLDNSSNADVQNIISTESNSNDMFDNPLTNSQNSQGSEQPSILESTQFLRINPKMQSVAMFSKMNVEHCERTVDTDNVLPTKFVVRRLSPILSSTESTSKEGFHSQQQNDSILNENFDHSKFSLRFQTASQLLFNTANCSKEASEELGDIKINICGSQPTSRLADSLIKEQNDLVDIDLFPSPHKNHDLEIIDFSQTEKQKSSESKLASDYKSESNVEMNDECDSSVLENIKENMNVSSSTPRSSSARSSSKLLSGGNNMKVLNFESEPPILESTQFVRIMPTIEPFETPTKLNVEHCERLNMDNYPTINDENEPSLLDYPPNFVQPGQKIQPFETPLKNIPTSVDIENITSPEGKILSFEFGDVDNNSFSEICFRQTESQHLTYLEEQKEPISKHKIKYKRKAKAGSLLQKALNIATRIDTNFTLFDYELKAGLRPSTGRQVSAPLEIISKVFKDDSLYLNCKSLSPTSLAARNFEGINSNIVVVVNNMSENKINSKFIIIHFPLEVFTNTQLKTLFVLAGNQIENISQVDNIENRQSNTKKHQFNDLESFSCSLMRSLNSNVSNSILDAAVGQLLMPEIVLNLLVLHIFSDVTKSVFVLLMDHEEQFTVTTFSGEAQLQYINVLINKNKIKQGSLVTFKGFLVTNMITLDERLKSFLEYCCGKIVNVSCLFSLKPAQEDWSIFTGINKEIEIVKESITVERLINENIQLKRYTVNNIFLEILEDCIFISDSPTGIKIKILFEVDQELNQVPKVLDGVFLNNNCIVADKYTRIQYTC